MRWLVLSVSALWGACFAMTYAVARIPPYHTHVDRHLGQDHVYPDRGAVMHDLPQGAIVVNYAGISYQFAGGVWYEPLGRVFIVVAPPIGLIVPQLPPLATTFDSDGKTYLYANDVFYRFRPDLGGYEVVNDPQDAMPQPSKAPAAPSPAVAPAPIPVATPQPSAAVQATAATRSVPHAPASAVAAPRYPIPAQPLLLEAPPARAIPIRARAATAPATSAAFASTVVTTLANPTRVIIYPRHGQSTNQQATDRYRCYRFAVARSRFDPLASNSGVPSARAAQGSAEYARAQAACLKRRGYAVQ